MNKQGLKFKMKIIFISTIVLFITGCTTVPEKGLRKDEVNLMAKSFNLDRANFNAGSSTSYGAASVGFVFAVPMIKAVASLFPTDYSVYFHDADRLNEMYKDENTSVASVVINSNNLDLIKNELNEYFVKNGFTFNEYNGYRGMFNKKVGERYPGIVVYVFPQSNQTIKLAINKENMDKWHYEHSDIHIFSGEFAINHLNRFKNEFEDRLLIKG